MQTKADHLFEFTIKRFRDGDTVEGFTKCRCCGGVLAEALRLPGIESHEPIPGREGPATVVARTLTDTFRGTSGVLTSNSVRRDRYGRRITDVLIDGELLTTKILAMGLAWRGVGEPAPSGFGLPLASSTG